MLNEFEEMHERAYSSQSLEGGVGTLYNTKDQKIKASEPNCSTRRITQEFFKKSCQRCWSKRQNYGQKSQKNYEHSFKE